MDERMEHEIVTGYIYIYIYVEGGLVGSNLQCYSPSFPALLCHVMS